MTNLLKNPSFEQDWGNESSHAAHRFIDRLDPGKMIEVGNIFTPPGWTTWFLHNDDYAQPEVRDARREVDEHRVYHGEKAMLFFTFYKRHLGGFYQQVEVETAHRYDCTVVAHAWSNHQDPNRPDAFPHPDDPRWSEGAGYSSEVYWPDQIKLCGDPQKDARANFTFDIGIDPYGETNPFSDRVIWSQPFHIYNEYWMLTQAFTARSSIITVFLRSETKWAFKHNDAYWDDCLIAEVPPFIPGDPREDYKRTYNVIPESATDDQAIAIFVESWLRSKETVGASYDDAMMGNLTDKTANLYGIPEEKQQKFIDFRDTHYPGTKIVFLPLPGEEPEPPPAVAGCYPSGCTGYYGLHHLGSYAGIDEFLAIQPPVFKAVLDMGKLPYVHERSPKTELVYRHWVADQNQYRLAPDKFDGAWGFLGRFMTDLQENVKDSGIKRIWIESLNETISHDFPDNMESVLFDLAFVEVLKTWEQSYRNAGLDIELRPVVFTAAVGNPQFPGKDSGWREMWDMILPLAEKTMQAKGAFGYHAYHAGNVDTAMFTNTSRYLQDRWMYFDEWLVEQGVQVYWFLGECGSCKAWEDSHGIHFDPGSGWKAVYDLERYLMELEGNQAVWRGWNEAQGNRLLGGTLFQSGSTDPAWKSFALEGNDLITLANAIKEWQRR